MSAALRIERGDAGLVRVGGRLGFAEAAAALARSGEVIDGANARSVDVGGLEGIDSATLAVLLAWSARASAADGSLRYVNAPEGLRALARLCDSETLLALAQPPRTGAPTASG